MKRTLLIYSRERHSKDGTRAFLTYSYVHNNTWYEVKFTKKCAIKPTDLGYLDLVIDDKDISIERSKRNDKVYNIIWVKKVISFNVNEEKNKELEEKKAKALADLFD